MNIEDYARSLQGVSIDFRRTEPLWPKPWRLKRYASKNSLAERRIVKYFDSFEDLTAYIEASAV